MSKVFALLLMIFIMYLFFSVSGTSKSEMVKVTVAIPQVTASTISNIASTVEKSLEYIK